MLDPIESRRTEVELLRIQGVTSTRAIARELAQKGINVSHATVHGDIQAIDAQYREANRDAIERERGCAQARLDSLIARCMSKLKSMDEAREQGVMEYELPDLQTIRLIKELEERKAKLLGLDRPSKIAHTDPSGEKEYTGIPESFKRRFLSGNKEEEEVIDAEIIPEIEGETRGNS